MVRGNVHNTIQGISVGGSVDVEDMYVHDGVSAPSIGNPNPMYVVVGGGPVIVRHDTILNPSAFNAAVDLTTDYGPEIDVGGGHVSQGIRVTGNHLSRRYSSAGGSAGPVIHWDGGALGAVWSGNVWDETGKPVPST